MLALLSLLLWGTPALASEPAPAPSRSPAPEVPAGYVSSTNRELIQTFVRYALGTRDFLGAEAALKDHLASDPRDAEALNLLGMTYLQTGQNTEAARQFLAAVKAVRREDPLRGYFLYNLADAYVRGGYVVESGKTLALLAQHPRLWLAASEVRGDLHPKKPLPTPRLVPPSRLSATALMVSGYDSNVVLASNSSIAAGDVSGAASPVLTPAMDFRWGWPVGYGDENWVVDARALYQWNLSETASRFNTLLAHAGVERSDLEPSEAGGFSNAWNVQADTAFLNSDGFGFYNAVVKAGWGAKWRVLDQSLLEVSIPVRYQRYASADSADDDRSGPGGGGSVAWRQRVNGAIASLGAGADFLLASGSNYVALTESVPFTLQFADLFWRTGLSISAGFENVQYLQSTDERADQHYSAGIGLRRTWGGRISTGIDYTYQQNVSTLDAADYSKHVVSFSIAAGVL